MIFLDIFSDPEYAGYLIGLILGSLVLFLIPFIFYLIAMQNTLKAIHESNRRMPPGNVWLMLIPVFNIVWQFVMVGRLAESIKNELNARGEITADKPTYGVGLTYSILFLFGRIPFIGGVTSLGALVCWIIYWVKVNEYKKKFLSEPYEPNQESQIFGYV